MGRRGARKEHLVNKALPLAHEARRKKEEEADDEEEEEKRPAYTALSASKPRSFENAVAKLGKCAQFNPRAQYNLLRKGWFAGTLPDNITVGFGELETFMYMLIYEQRLINAYTVFDPETKKASMIVFNPACGYEEAKAMLANGTCHEGGCHVASNVDGFYSQDSKKYHGPEFAVFEKLIPVKTGVPISIKLPRVPNQALLLELMKRLATLLSEVAGGAVKWTLEHLGPLSKQEFENKVKCAEVIAETMKYRQAKAALAKAAPSESSDDDDDTEPRKRRSKRKKVTRKPQKPASKRSSTKLKPKRSSEAYDSKPVVKKAASKSPRPKTQKRPTQTKAVRPKRIVKKTKASRTSKSKKE